MASIVNKLRRWLRTPQGQQARSRAERLARDPRTKAKIRSVMQRRRRRY